MVSVDALTSVFGIGSDRRVYSYAIRRTNPCITRGEGFSTRQSC